MLRVAGRHNDRAKPAGLAMHRPAPSCTDYNAVAIGQRCYFPTASHDQLKRMPNEAANPTGQTGFCDNTQKP
jgi:hypothetical protein